MNRTEDLNFTEVQMEKLKKQRLVERYGKINIIIVALCVILFVINSVIVSESALSQLASNKYLAYFLDC